MYRDMCTTFGYCVVLLVLYLKIVTGVDYPTEWHNNNWEDSYFSGPITISGDKMSGLSLFLYGVTYNDSWTCQLVQNDMVVSKLDVQISTVIGNKDVYLCQKYKMVTSSMFSYYLISDKNYNTGGSLRLKVTTQAVTNVCDVCTANSNPTDADYYVMRSDGGDLKIALATLYPKCAKVGCDQCSTQCSGSDFTCTARARTLVVLDDEEAARSADFKSPLKVDILRSTNFDDIPEDCRKVGCDQCVTSCPDGSSCSSATSDYVITFRLWFILILNILYLFVIH